MRLSSDSEPHRPGASGQRRPMGGRRSDASRALLLACSLLLGTAETAGQTLSERYAPLVIATDEPGQPAQPCCSRALTRPGARIVGADRVSAQHEGDEWALDDGEPLHARQVPRFIHPQHDGRFGYREFLVAGDHETVTFQAIDVAYGNATGSETWNRVGTRTISGHLVSIFEPEWDSSFLRRVLRNGNSRWGVDVPEITLGEIVSPEGRRWNVPLSIVPPDIPASAVVRIDDRMQYASHVVNIRDDGFADSTAWSIQRLPSIAPELAKRFYEHFEDTYEVLAFVSARQHMRRGAFRTTVRNPISGTGKERFDDSRDYGSNGVLREFEGYVGGQFWPTLRLVLHEQGHQWGDYTDWGSLRPQLRDGGRAWQPDQHTPLLYPGAVVYSYRITGNSRLARVPGDGRRFRREVTLPLVTYHPLTLYRMGLLEPADFPTLLVFRDQGILETLDRWDSPFTGETIEVTVNDLMAADGIRRGPVDRRVRRGIVYVSQDRLLEQSEMDVINYFARRLGESSGVTSWDRFPSFTEATGGLATMTTDIRPLHQEAAALGADVRCARVGTHALVGVVLDEEVGGCLQAGDTVRVSGTLTLDDRDDYNVACLRFEPYTNGSDGVILACDALDRGNRFEVEVTFPGDLATGYRVSLFAYWPAAGSQEMLSTYTGGIEVVGEQ